MPVVRVPLVGNPSERTPDSDTDLRLVNCFIDKQDKQTVALVKRPGLLKDDDTASGAGRGIISWDGDLYAIVDTTLYRNGTAVSGTIAGTGKVYFADTPGVSPILLIKSNSKLYGYTVSGGIVEVTDGDYPGDTVGGLEYFDTYTVVMDDLAFVYNSEAADHTDWDPTNNLGAQVKGDDGVRIIRHINYLVILGEKTTEVFYDAANATGSPFQRLEGTPSLIGCAASGAAINVDRKLLWISRSEGGGHEIVEMEGFSPKKVSSLAVDRDLEDEGANIGNALAFYTRVAGHSFAVFRLTNKTWAYDVDLKSWSEWTMDDGATEGNFDIVETCEHNNRSYGLHATTGEIFILDMDTYQDDSQDINVLIQTNRWDGEFNQNKFCSRLELISDAQASGDVSISWTDDDYVTFSNPKAITMSNKRRFITRLGNFQRRAFKLTHTANTPLRLFSLELNVRRGHYGQ